ncbi:response regulator [bacterium]|nr:response regulator [bacterium]
MSSRDVVEKLGLLDQQLQLQVRLPLQDLSDEIELYLQEREGESGGSPSSDRPMLEHAAASLRKVLRGLGFIDWKHRGEDVVEKFSLREILESLEKDFYHRFRERGIHFVVEAHAEVPEFIQGSRESTHLALASLMEESLITTPSGGGVVLHVSSSSFTKDALTLRFSLANSGEGIPQHVMEKLSDGDVGAYGNSLSPLGSGFRLSLVAEIVNQIGGTLHFQSEQGIGKKIAFSLECLPVTSPGELSFEGLRVLVVDDNRINRLVVRKFLEREGFLVDEAESGAGAVAAFELQRYHLTLLDIMMPEMNGYQVLEVFREMDAERNRDHPSVIFAHTALGDPENVKRITECGFNGILRKPFSSDALRKLLEEYYAEISRCE